MTPDQSMELRACMFSIEPNKGDNKRNGTGKSGI